MGRLTIGPFTCVLSFDESPNAAFPYQLHLSVSHLLGAAPLSGPEQGFVVSLSFLPGEVPFLQAEPGQIKPVIHYYLGAHAPELNEC